MYSFISRIIVAVFFPCLIIFLRIFLIVFIFLTITEFSGLIAKFSWVVDSIPSAINSRASQVLLLRQLFLYRLSISYMQFTASVYSDYTDVATVFWIFHIDCWKNVLKFSMYSGFFRVWPLPNILMKHCIVGKYSDSLGDTHSS